MRTTQEIALISLIKNYYNSLSNNKLILKQIADILEKFNFCLSTNPAPLYVACAVQHNAQPANHNERKYEVLKTLFKHAQNQAKEDPKTFFANTPSADIVFAKDPNQQMFQQFGGGILHWLLSFNINTNNHSKYDQTHTIEEKYIIPLYLKARKLGARFDISDAMGKTVLHWAAEYHLHKLVNIIAMTNPDILEIQDNTGLFAEQNALISASWSSFQNISRKLKSLHEIPKQLGENMRKLRKTFLEKNEFDDINSVKILGDGYHTPLTASLQLFSNAKSSPEGSLAREQNMSTAYKVMLSLLEKNSANNGINIDQDPTNNDKSPLMYATHFAFSDMMRLLIEKGADLFHVNKQGYNLFDNALDSINPLESITALLKHISDNDIKSILINFQDSFGQTPLHWSVIQSTPEIVGLLLASGADANILNKNGKTALDLALVYARIQGEQYKIAEQETSQIQQILLASGAKCSNTTLLTSHQNYAILSEISDLVEHLGDIKIPDYSTI